MRVPLRISRVASVLLVMTLAVPAVAAPTGTHRWRAAAARAAKDPHTWAPAGAAAAVVLLDADQRISDWAVSNTPVFGSIGSAGDASDDLRQLSHVAMLTTALVAPRDHPGFWGSRWGRLLVDEVSVQAVKTATGGLKSVTGRERPNGTDDRSLPSGHTSAAFGYAALARRNVLRMGMPRGGRIACDATFDVVAGLTGWARVEAGAHYPTDVLVGASLGNFLSSWLEEGMLGHPDVRAAVDASPDGVTLSVAWSPTPGWWRRHVGARDVRATARD